MSLFTTSLTDKSVLYLFISALIGGVVAAFAKLIFEVVLGGHIQQRREQNRLVERYSTPIAIAADSLARRLANIAQNSSKDWIKTSEYYRLSCFYLVCVYFAWVEILTGGVVKLRMGTSRDSRALGRALALVDKAFNNLVYFSKGAYSQESRTSNALPKFVCKALGELSIDSKTGAEPSCIGFADFCKLAGSDENYLKWLKELNRFFDDISNSAGNATWDRLHLIELSLIALTNTIDSRHVFTRKYSLRDLVFIKSKINEPFAAEVISGDVMRWNAPLRLEDFKSRCRRRYNRFRTGAWEYPEVSVHYSNYRAEDCTLNVDSGSYQLNDPRQRRRWYVETGAQVLRFARQRPFGVKIRVNVSIGEIVPAVDVLQRMGQNISDFSEGRVKSYNVVFFNSGRRVRLPSDRNAEEQP